MLQLTEHQQIVRFGRLLYENRFIAGSEGNLSIRLSDGNILITPSGVGKGFLCEEDLVIVDSEGRQMSGQGRASSELLMHLYVYNMRPEIKACCHAHPPYTTAFSVAKKVLPSNILPEIILSVGDIPLTEYASPGTAEVPHALEKYILEHTAFVLRSHGALTIGRTAEEAYNRMEIVEHYAKIIYIAENAGKLNSLDAGEVKRLLRIRETLMTGK